MRLKDNIYTHLSHSNNANILCCPKRFILELYRNCYDSDSYP